MAPSHLKPATGYSRIGRLTRVHCMNSQSRGRPEFTSTNKDKVLLWNGDGSYCLPASHYQVAEARSFRQGEAVGEVRPNSSRAVDNLLTAATPSMSSPTLAGP